MFSDILTAISQVGFPIAVTFYLLFRFEKTIDRICEMTKDNTEAIRDLRDMIFRKL